MSRSRHYPGPRERALRTANGHVPRRDRLFDLVLREHVVDGAREAWQLQIQRADGSSALDYTMAEWHFYDRAIVHHRGDRRRRRRRIAYSARRLNQILHGLGRNNALVCVTCGRHFEYGHECPTWKFKRLGGA